MRLIETVANREPIRCVNSTIVKKENDVKPSLELSYKSSPKARSMN